MDQSHCPGARHIRSPKPETIQCAACSGEVEIWSDESCATCPYCKATVARPGRLSCLEWCAQGRECVGDEVFSRYLASRDTPEARQVKKR